MASKRKAAESRERELRDAFEGLKGRQPATDGELKDWLISDEGKQATMFKPADVFVWGEMHAGGVRATSDNEKFRSDLLHE